MLWTKELYPYIIIISSHQIRSINFVFGFFIKLFFILLEKNLHKFVNKIFKMYIFHPIIFNGPLRRLLLVCCIWMKTKLLKNIFLTIFLGIFYTLFNILMSNYKVKNPKRYEEIVGLKRLKNEIHIYMAIKNYIVPSSLIGAGYTQKKQILCINYIDKLIDGLQIWYHIVRLYY